MAQRPLSQEYIQANLPSNLPENWINDNYLMADDLANPEYGYNYLNKQINNTQNAIKVVNSYFDNYKKIIVLQKRGDPVDDSYYAAATGSASLNQTVNWEIPISGPYSALISYNIDLYSNTSSSGGTGHKIDYLVNGVKQNTTYDFTSSIPGFRTTHTNQILLENRTDANLVFSCNAGIYRNGKSLSGSLYLKGWIFTLTLFYI